MKRLIYLVLVTLVASGCAATPYQKSISDAKFLKLDASERTQYTEQITSDFSALEAKRSAEFAAGLPVLYGDKRTGFTIQWIKIPGKYDQVALYLGHQPKGMGSGHEAMQSFSAYKNGELVYGNFLDQNGIKVERPIDLIGNVATNQSMKSLVATGLFQMGAAALNGVVGSAIIADKQCGKNCGSSITAIAAGGEALSLARGGDANAAAGSSSEANANAQQRTGGHNGKL